MKKCLAFLTIVLLMGASACSRITPEERALKAAKKAAEQSYGHLLAQRYSQFLEGRSGMDSISPAYREQLMAAYSQFMAQQQAAHGGIASLRVSNARMDSTLHLVQVFMLLAYNDSTQEEIVVPMVEQENGEWKMK